MTHDRLADDCHSHSQPQRHAHGHEGCCGPSRRGFLKTAALVTGGALIPGGLLAQAPAGASRKRIDTHFHYYPPGVGGELGSGISKRWSTQIAQDEMDKNGIVSAVLSVSSAPDEWWRLDAQQLRGKVRALNDFAAQMVRDQPKRYGQFAFLSMADVDGTLKEIAYALDELKADGIGLSTSYGNQFLGDPDFRPVMDELQRRRALVYVHPGRPDCCDTLTPQVPGSFTECPQDTNRTVMSLLFSGTFTRTRDVRWIFSHGGAAVPLLAGRVNSLAKIQLKNQAQVLPDGIDFELKRLYYETANAAYSPNMAALLKFASASQVLFGTDYPYVSVVENANDLMKAGLSALDLKAIENENALRLMPRLKT